MTYDDPSDPAREAMREPEPLDPGRPVHVVGIGPGDPAYRTRRADECLSRADVVLGFESAVERVRDEASGEVLACGYETEAEQLERFARCVESGAEGVVVMTGDPNVSDYQFLGKVERAVDRPVRVVPGVSSLQVAASRARVPLEGTTFVTLHRSGPIEAGLARLVDAVGDRHLAVLPRPYDWMPGAIAAHLLEAGADPSLEAIVFERLTREDETATRSTLGELAEARPEESREPRFSDLSVLVVRRDLA